MTIRWTPAAAVSARRFMRTIVEAVGSLADDLYSAEALHRGEYHQLRVSPYRIVYVIGERS